MGKNCPTNARNARDKNSISGLGRSSGKGNDTIPYSCLENSMDRGPGRLQSMESQRVRHN